MPDKELRISISPIPLSDDSELEIQFEGRDIGSLTLIPGDLAEFVEGLRVGFRVVFVNRS
jgi:hypothetical protein